jgi:serine/threonine protein kinase
MNKGLSPDTQISHYRIVSKLGEGGMGEVYLAQDTKLERKVALKVLPDNVAADGERLKRFGQEARAASALNHPNILTIYEIGEADGANYISTEFVDGETLRDILHARSMSTDKTLDVSIQIASALAAAHEAGIIHRDIKPENIMLRSDGLVKVLDFGLAKLSENSPNDVDTEGETRAQVKTAPGVIMGTVQYMSPEQTRAKPTDARSDIWSLGCVIYEMAAGRPPFSGETSADLIAEIVRMDPEPLAQVVPDAPERLDEIISKALEKSPDERYQTVKDLLIDLRRLKKKIDAGSELERSHAPNSLTSGDIGVEGRKTEALKASTRITGEAAGSTSSGAQYLTSGIKQHKFGSAIIGLVVLLILGGFGYGIYKFLEPPSAETVARNTDSINTQRLTGDGKTREAEISPDGRFLAYIRTEGEERSIWLKQIQTNSNIPIIKPGELDGFNNLVFSPDGNFVHFSAEAKEEQAPSVYRISILGGAPTKVISNGFALEFSSDGKQISYLRFDFKANESSVLIADSDGRNERKLAGRSGKQYFEGPAAWSADGRFLAAVIGDDSLPPGLAKAIGLIAVADGSVTELADVRFTNIDDMVWHPTGDSLIIAATESGLGQSQLWEIAYPSGTKRRLTSNLNGHYSVSITSDGKSLVTGEIYSRSAIWVSPDLKPENAKQVMPDSGDTWGFGWTPDNRIVYVSDQTGDAEIWIMDADGANAKALTNDRIFKTTPVVSPDGRYIVYTSSANGGTLVRIDINGGNKVEIYSGNGADNPDISPDGKWILYSAWIDGISRILRVGIDGGEPQILKDWAIEPRYSRDGSRFACFTPVEKTQYWSRLAIVPAEGGDEIAAYDTPSNTNIGRGPIWTPDDKGISVVISLGEKQELWLQSVDGGPGRQITDIGVPGIARRDYSRDGKRIAIVRAQGFGNAIMLTDYR